MPWPISERAMRTTTVSSGLITTQALISGEPPWARTTSRTAERNIEAERKPAARGGSRDDEGAAIHFPDIVHGVPPFTRSQRQWIASRTCW